MAEVDTSSYPKPQSGQNPLAIAGQLQQLQSNQLGIDRQKLDLANEHFNIVNNTLGSLLYKPDLTADDIVGESQKLVNLGLMTPDHFSQFVSAIPTGSQLQKDSQALQKYLTITRNRAISNMDALNWYATGGRGTGTLDTGGTIQPYGLKEGAMVPTGAPIAKTLPPTTPGFQPPSKQFPTGREAPIGPPNLPVQPQGPSQGFYGQAPAQQQAPMGGAISGATSVQTIPVRKPLITAPPPARLPIQGGPVQGGAQGISGQEFNDRFTGQTLPGSPPYGFGQAENVAGQASGEALAKARQASANFQREIYPLTQAIPAMENLGTKGTGPGTETLNNIKSFILSNVPGVTENQLSSVKSFDEAKKYMVDFVNQTGNTGTNDKLAAAFAGNPSVHISNAAAVDVLKSALSLRLMQQAQLLQFEKSGQPANMYSRWTAQANNQLDPRAFGVNYMSPDAKQKLLAQLKQNPKEYEMFERSLQVAKDAGYIVLGQPNK